MVSDKMSRFKLDSLFRDVKGHMPLQPHREIYARVSQKWVNIQHKKALRLRPCLCTDKKKMDKQNPIYCKVAQPHSCHTLNFSGHVPVLTLNAKLRSVSHVV